MVTKTTAMFPVTTKVTSRLLINEETAHRIDQAFHYVLYPCSGVLIIVGNITNIIILTRQGFHKCSNVLLLALAISDVLHSIGLNRLPCYICTDNSPGTFMFSEAVNHMCYIFFVVFMCAYVLGNYSKVLIPVLITGERILAICFPLKAYIILTPRHTIIVVSCLYCVVGIYFLYSYILSLKYQTYVIRGVRIGALVYTDMYISLYKSGISELIGSIVNIMTGIIPICLVAVGCLIICVRIIQVTKRRQQLTSGQKPASNTSMKTTKTLLSICVLYIVCYGFSFVMASITEMEIPEANELQLVVVLKHIEDMLQCIHSIGDFIIYFRANKMLRQSRNGHLRTCSK